MSVATLLLGALALRAIIVAQSAAQDDAYITYRYAANLAGSLGFVYNEGERVLGTTTPLFTLLLGIAARAGLPPDAFSPWLAVLFDVMVGFVGWFALRSRLNPHLAFLWLLFYATFYLPLQACTHGMESQLFLLLILTAFLAFDGRRVLVTGALVGLAFLVRPEAVLLVPLLLLEGWLGGRWLRWRGTLLLGASALAVILPWLAFALSYFGSIVPSSVTAKQFGGHATFDDWVGAFIGRNPILYGLWGLFFVGAVTLLRKSRTMSRLWLGWTVLYLLFMLIGRPPFYATWYVPAVNPGLLLGIAAAALATAGWVIREAKLRTGAIAVAWIAMVAVVWSSNMASVRGYRVAIETVYFPMGAWLREQATPSETIFAGDIGFIGWLSGCRILDAAGLVSPRVARFYRQRGDDPHAAVDLVVAEKPRFVIVSTQSPAFTHWTAPEFEALYERVQRFQRTDAVAGRRGPDSDYTVFELRGSRRAP